MMENSPGPDFVPWIGTARRIWDNQGVQSATRTVISLALGAGIICAGTTYFTHDPRPYRQQALEARDAGRIDRAAALYQKQVDLETATPRDWYELGLLRARLNQPDQALENFRTAARLQGDLLGDPTRRGRGWGGAHYDLACFRALAGDTDGALTALEKAISLGFIDTSHITSDPDLVSLRNTPRYDAAVALANQRRAERDQGEADAVGRPRGRQRRAD